MNSNELKKFPVLVSDTDVCEYFGITKNSLWRLRKLGKLNGLKISGKVVFRLEEIEKFIRSTEKLVS